VVLDSVSIDVCGRTNKNHNLLWKDKDQKQKGDFFAHEISIFEERKKERKSKGILILLLSAGAEAEEDRASSRILSLLMVVEVQKPQSTTTAFIPYKRFQDKGKERKKERNRNGKTK
jgi:hypothetical protein